MTLYVLIVVFYFSCNNDNGSIWGCCRTCFQSCVETACTSTSTGWVSLLAVATVKIIDLDLFPLFIYFSPLLSSLPETESSVENDSFDVAESQALMSRLQWDGSSDISPSDSASSKASKNVYDCLMREQAEVIMACILNTGTQDNL